MIFAQIKKGIIYNTIVLDDLSLVQLFQQGFDHLERIDHLQVIPRRGDLFDGKDFSYADDVAPEKTDLQKVEDKFSKLVDKLVEAKVIQPADALAVAASVEASIEP